MSVNQWLMLWMIFLSYLLLGAFIFYTIERHHEERHRETEIPEKLDIEDLLNTYFTWTNNRAHQQLILKLRQYCNGTRSNPMLELEDVIEIEDEFQWTFYNSFFFALTTLSTIGYGNLHPTSCLGRVLVIVYSLVGIPLNGIVLTQLGDFFASTFLRVHEQYKDKRVETKLNLFMDIATYLIPGILLFIFLPSGFFVYFEGWTFEQSIYYAYVTLTTIGYGDYVAGQLANESQWYYVYKIVLIFWIIFGLGYLVMILSFITQAMRSKKMAYLERKLAQNLRYAQSRVLREINRDISSVRRLLNEFYLLKYKPVYQNESKKPSPIDLKRTQSAPNLSEWPVPIKISDVSPSSEDEEETRMMFEKQRMKRRKALSENLFRRQNLRTRSESDILGIDKDATFNNCTHVDSNQFMVEISKTFQRSYSQLQRRRIMSFIGVNEENLSSLKVSQFEELSRENALKNYKTSATGRTVVLDSKISQYSNTGQLTWPGTKNIVNGNKIKLPRQPTFVGKRSSIPLLGVQNFRRVSIAAMNLLNPSKHEKSVITREDHANVHAELGCLNNHCAIPKCGQIESHLAHSNHDDIYGYCDGHNPMHMKKSNVQSTLCGQRSVTNNANPIIDIERASIGGFFQIFDMLAIENDENKLTSEEETKSKDLQFFTSFQNENNVEDRSHLFSTNCRRYSSMTTKAANVTNKSFCSNNKKPILPFKLRVEEQNCPIEPPQSQYTCSNFSIKASTENSNEKSSHKRKDFCIKPISKPAIIHSDPSSLQQMSIVEPTTCQTTVSDSVCDNNKTEYSKL